MPGIKALKKISTDNQEMTKFQDYVEQALSGVLNSKIVDGVQLNGIELTAGQFTPVEHKLGRKPLGYVIVGRNANATVWDTESPLPSKTLMLRPSANVTVSLWVY